MTVRFFASLRERFGENELRLELNDSASLSDLLARLLEPSERERVMVAVNNKLVPDAQRADLLLRDGDVVDIMPPASGG